jgi:hypothetical protein
VEPAAQPVTPTAAQAQLVVEQQTPGQAAAQVPPQVNTFGATQEAGATTVQTPVVELQHLPVQGLGEQTLVRPW